MIGIGNAANAFLETYIELPAEYLAEFVAVPPTSATETPSITSATTTTATRQASKKSCFLFQCGTFVLCMVKYKVEAKDAHGWINTVSPPKILSPERYFPGVVTSYQYYLTVEM